MGLYIFICNIYIERYFSVTIIIICLVSHFSPISWCLHSGKGDNVNVRQPTYVSNHQYHWIGKESESRKLPLPEYSCATQYPQHCVYAGVWSYSWLSTCYARKLTRGVTKFTLMISVGAGIQAISSAHPFTSITWEPVL